jgi:hypothetical protein
MRAQGTVRAAGELTPLLRLFRANWRPLLLTYALYNVENLLSLAHPLVLGVAINGLIRSEYRGLALLVGQHLAHLFVGTARHAGVGVSTVAARSGLSRELVDFFEHHLKAVFASIYGVIGALAMLVVYDRLLVLLCGLMLAPLVILSRRLARRSFGVNAALNDQLEREVEVIEDGRTGLVSDHYCRLARYQVRLSDLGAWNFLQMEFFVLALIVAALARYCARPGVEAGDIYAVFAYILMFIGGLDCVPMLIQQLARLHDIGGRVALEEGE